MTQLRTLGLVAALASATACGQERPAPPDRSRDPATKVTSKPHRPGSSPANEAGADGEEGAGLPSAGYAISRGRSVQWKRAAALEADLVRALELTKEELCSELGSSSCIREVHTVALGTNDPFGTGLLRPAAAPLSTTPLVVDRVTLSACSARVRKDKEGTAIVFDALDLSGPAPAAEAKSVTATITTLFRRLLARDPKPGELTAVRELLNEREVELTAEEFATLSCFVIASSLESLFF